MRQAYERSVSAISRRSRCRCVSRLLCALSVDGATGLAASDDGTVGLLACDRGAGLAARGDGTAELALSIDGATGLADRIDEDPSLSALERLGATAAAVPTVRRGGRTGAGAAVASGAASVGRRQSDGLILLSDREIRGSKSAELCELDNGPAGALCPCSAGYGFGISGKSAGKTDTAGDTSGDTPSDVGGCGEVAGDSCWL